MKIKPDYATAILLTITVLYQETSLSRRQGTARH